MLNNDTIILIALVVALLTLLFYINQSNQLKQSGGEDDCEEEVDVCGLEEEKNKECQCGQPAPAPTPAPAKCVFDAKKYSDFYPDLKKLFNYDEVALKKHYLDFGLSEGRTPCGSDNATCKWSATDYLTANPDVKAAGMDATNHYKQYGINEGRTPCPTPAPAPAKCVFDAKKYSDFYPDLKKLFNYDEVALKKHYLDFGLTEGRTPCGSDNTTCKWSATDYLTANPDVKAAGMDATNHYKQYGINEGRTPCPVPIPTPMATPNKNKCPKLTQFKTLVSNFNTNQSMQINNILDLTNQFTLSISLKVNDYSNKNEWQHILHAGTANASKRTPGIWINQGKLHIRATTKVDWNEGLDVTELVLNKNTTYHLIVVYQINKITVYIDGKKIKTHQTRGEIIPERTLYLGKTAHFSGPNMDIKVSYLPQSLTDGDVELCWKALSN